MTDERTFANADDTVVICQREGDNMAKIENYRYSVEETNVAGNDNGR